jgi:hypothetical protein
MKYFKIEKGANNCTFLFTIRAIFSQENSSMDVEIS